MPCAWNASIASTCLRMDCLAALRSAGRIALAALEPLLHRPATRQIAVDRIVRAGLVGHGIRTHAAAHQLGQHVRRVAEQRDRFRFAGRGVLRDARQRVVQIGRLLVDVARLQAEVDAALLAFDIQRARARERRGQRLRAAHAAQAGSENPLALAGCRRNAGGPSRRRSRTCPARCPASRCRSTSRPSSGRTSSGPSYRAR